MNTYAIRSTLVRALGVALALASGSALAISFRITDLGTLGGLGEASLNASGQVTGSSTTASGETHAFLWDGTTMRDLGTLGGTVSGGSAINDAGQVTGSSTTASGETHAFLWDGTTMRDLGTLGGGSSAGSDINASGQVTGGASTADGFGHAFLWDGTTMVDLGTLGGTGSIGRAINDAGQVTGSSSMPDEPGFDPDHAFLWDGMRMQDLGATEPFLFLNDFETEGVAINASGQVTGFAASEASLLAFLWDGTTMHVLRDPRHESGGLAINDAGQVTGFSSFLGSESGFNAFLWDGTTLLDLGTLDEGDLGAGTDINNRGQVTGDSNFTAFLWDGTTMLDLNALIDPADPLQRFVTLHFGVAINDLGQILVRGSDSRFGEDQLRTYLVSPIPGSVPEPGTLALLALGLAGLSITRRRSTA